MLSLIHPSRGRAKKAKDTLNNWITKSTGEIEIEHIISVDSDDNQLQLYKSIFSESVLIENTERHDVVFATNNAAQYSKGNLLIYLSDDFDCPQNWDRLITEEINRYLNNTEVLLKVDDCLQKFEVGVLTIPIMNRKLYQTLKYFFYPEYKSMFCDEDLFWTCKNNHWIRYAPALKFPHLHWCNGKTNVDETYKRSETNWDSGKAIFNNRKKQNFPL